jgi:hypothetical protein
MSETADERADGDGSDGTYSGLLGAFPYAFRTSESRLFRAYAVVGGLLTLLLGLFFALAVVAVFGRTAGAGGGTFTFSRSLFVLVGFFAVAPLVAPVLFVARQHRRGLGDVGYDRTMAALGVLFVASLYVAVVMTVPESFVLDGETVTRDAPTGLLAPLIRVLYAAPPVSGVVPPTAVALVMYLTHRRLR